MLDGGASVVWSVTVILIPAWLHSATRAGRSASVRWPRARVAPSPAPGSAPSTAATAPRAASTPYAALPPAPANGEGGAGKATADKPIAEEKAEAGDGRRTKAEAAKLGIGG